ncbi:MAG: tetratricopeptide repeat protein [Chitinophagales bacterium]
MKTIRLNQIVFKLLSGFLFFASMHCQATNVDSLCRQVEIFEGTRNYQVLSQTYAEIGDFYFKDKDYEYALINYKNALENMRKAGQKNIELYFHLGRTYHRMNQFDDALDNYFMFLEHKGEKIDLEKKVNALGSVAKIYQEMGNFKLAYNYRLQALQIYEEIPDSLGIARSVYEIGNIYFYQFRFESALEYFTRTLIIAEKIGNETAIYASLGAIGSTYERLDKIEESLEYNLKALKLAEEMDYVTGIAYATQNVGSNYFNIGKCDLALQYLNKSWELKSELGDKWGEVESLRAIGNVYVDLDKFSVAINYFKNALSIAHSIGSRPRIIEVYESMGEAYRRNGDISNAYKYQTAYLNLKDSLLNENTLQEMNQAKINYEMYKKEREIGLLKKENELLQKQQEIRFYQNASLMGMAFFTIFTTALFLYYRKLRQYNEMLKTKSEQIQQQNEELETINHQQIKLNKLLANKNDHIQEQNQQLENSNLELRQFAYIASHDLKEPLRTISSYTSLLDRRYKKELDQDAQEFMGFVTDAVKRMYALLDDLLAYSKVGSQHQTKKSINTKELVDSVISILQPTIHQKNAKIHLHFLPTIKASQVQMQQLFQNLISNALKFQVKEDPQVWVDCQKKDNLYVFSIKDNGIGIEEDYQQKIFEMFRRLHTKEEYEGTGIGLATCKKIVEQHGGQIWVESGIGQGSTFFFTLPIDQPAKNGASVEKMQMV